MHLQELIDIMATKSQNKDLSANRRKSEVMTNKKNHCVPECNIKVNGLVEKLQIMPSLYFHCNQLQSIL